MSGSTLPTLILAATVCSYWTCVALMVLRVSANAGQIVRVLIPERRVEQWLWLIWWPLVVVWMALPAVALTRWSSYASAPLLGETWTGGPAWTALRWSAAGLAVLCLAASIRCWRHMGARWRMAVDPRQRGELITDGPFALVRHPIYALGLLLALCSVVVLPTAPMLVLAGVYGALILLKVREEERFLRETYGPAYAHYRAQTGRFVPRPAVLSRTMLARATAATQEIPKNPADQLGRLRLNSFQRAMLLWEHLHPYNAAHAIHLAQPASPAALHAAIQRACRDAGIGALEVDEDRGTYRYLPTDGVTIQDIAFSGEPLQALSDLLTRELNRPFPAGPHHPIRWFILDDPQTRSHHLVAVYRHVAADAHAIELLLASVLSEFTGEAFSPAISWRSFDCRRLMTSLRRTRLGLLAAFHTAVLYFRFRGMHKMPDERTGGDETRVLLRPLAPGLTERLLHACRKAAVGPNDLFAAVLAGGIADLTPDRHVSRRRRAMSLATSLNARSVAANVDLSNWFGNCVGDMLLMIDRPDGSVHEVVAQVSRQTQRQKKRRAYALAVSSARRFYVRHIWPLFQVPHHRRSYRKLFPVCGGVSTVLVKNPRFRELSGQIGNYWRACPPGPAMPVVLAPTIFDSRLTLGLTYRTSCLNAQQAAELLDVVCARLGEFAMAPQPAEVPRPAKPERRVPEHVR